ncbi:hypothetical protein QJ857_gp0900 [Tupanvirus soda lake]|uniref:Sulfite exporter TauE/SafE n=2 Tax=Tupanvirus TaxID=2094720 RepID=A0A6N1NYQ3_9VIRU|nr:hypothetical protein QJ857_gp0900 [Tupanvirus soda lake]QKU35152.1 hypothetical protein [Tupanvirus soda lake]
MKYIVLLLFLISFVHAEKNDTDKVIFDENTYPTDIATVFFIFVVSIFTTITGVGGGSLYVSIFMLINNFEINVAIPLSVSTIVGSTFIRVLYFYNKEQPAVRGRSLIYYFPILIIVPFIANTSFVGIIFQKLFPKIISFIVILLLLGYSFYKTFLNGIKKYHEKKSLNSQIENNTDETESYENINTKITIDGIELGTKKYEYFEEKTQLELDGIPIYSGDVVQRTVHNNAKDSVKKNIITTIILFIIIIVITVFSVLRKNHSICSYKYAIISLLQFFSVSMFGLLVYLFIKNEQRIRRDNNYLSTESDIIFTKLNILKLIVISSITGVLATYIGIGGGTLIVPLMIHLGISPDVVVATSSMAAFFTSVISTINYAMESKIMPIYAIVYIFFSVLGSCVGILIFKYINKSKQYLIVFIVCFIIFSSAILLIINLFVQEGTTIFKNIHLNDICVDN